MRHPAGDRLKDLRLAVAVETSGAPGSAAACRGERVAERVLEERAVHGRGLLPALEACVVEAGGSPSEIDLVVVGVGPGSYTGLRVGIAAAKTLAFVRRCPIVGVCSSEAIAANAPARAEWIAVAIDARRGEVFASLYRRRGREAVAERAPSLLTPRDLARIAPPGTLVLGDGAAAYAEEWRAVGLSVGEREGGRARASILLRLGLRAFAARGGDDPGAVRPLYLRASAAEEKRASARLAKP